MRTVISINKGLHQKLRIRAAQLGMKMTEVAEQALNKWLKSKRKESDL